MHCNRWRGVEPGSLNINDGKAGRSRWKGKRPHVRGVVMNPVDHPHGGGEGRTSGGRHPVTRGASRPRASARARTSRPTSSSCARATSARSKRGSQWLVQFGKARLLTAIFSRRLTRPAKRPQRSDQDLEPPLHHHAAVRRPDLRRLQRQQAHSGQRVRRHGRPQVRRIRPTRTYYGHGADKKAKRK
jgi:hypothetical protein